MGKVFKHIVIDKDMTQIGVINQPQVLQQEIVPEPEAPSYQTGFAKGLAEGLSRIEDSVQIITTLINNIPEALCEQRLQNKSEIADIVLQISQQLFINQQLNQDSITQQISQLLSQMNHKQTIEIALHPHELQLLQQGEIKLDVKLKNTIRFKADEELRLGGCKIYSEQGVFNASIERQIDHLKQVLLDIRDGKQHDE